MTKLLLLILLVPSLVLAFDTYVFRVQINQVRPRSTVQTFFNNRGVQSDYQPGFQTYVLSQPDTNYVLVKITPNDDTENTLAISRFGLANVDLWGQLHVEPDQEPQWIVDNREVFPVNRDWSVFVSS